MMRYKRVASSSIAAIDFLTDAGENNRMKAVASELSLDRWPYGLEIRYSNNGLVLRPRHKARAGWTKGFRRVRAGRDEFATFLNFQNKFDSKEWKW